MPRVLRSGTIPKAQGFRQYSDRVSRHIASRLSSELGARGYRYRGQQMQDGEIDVRDFGRRPFSPLVGILPKPSTLQACASEYQSTERCIAATRQLDSAQ